MAIISPRITLPKRGSPRSPKCIVLPSAGLPQVMPPALLPYLLHNGIANTHQHLVFVFIFLRAVQLIIVHTFDRLSVIVFPDLCLHVPSAFIDYFTTKEKPFLVVTLPL
ncbi:hypothetical protein ECG_08267 [Echinococcus granulosus]|nr:hypothetical protein ECG_08267 [Echinococcus granulosus]